MSFVRCLMEERDMKLGQEIPLVMLNFTLSEKAVKKGALPKLVQMKRPETAMEMAMRKESVATGIRVIEPTKRVSLVNLVEELTVTNDILVKAWHQERQMTINSRLDKKIWIVRYEFGIRPPHDPNNPYICSLKDSDILYELIEEFCYKVLWRVDAFLNPYFENCEVVENRGTISIDLDSREESNAADHYLYVGEQSKNLCLVDEL